VEALSTRLHSSGLFADLDAEEQRTLLALLTKVRLLHRPLPVPGRCRHGKYAARHQAQDTRNRSATGEVSVKFTMPL
jgi:hypothetical protein